MSEKTDGAAPSTPAVEPAKPQETAAAQPPSETLEAVEEVDFLLEEIESKIAPLALA
jgi:hypothetical protein